MFLVDTLLVSLALFAGMLGLIEFGARLGRRRLERDPEGARAGTAATDGAVFALLGLLIAFTFAGAAERFERRRALLVSEVDAIGTAWSRLDLLAEPARAKVQGTFRTYFDARLAVYAAAPDLAAVRVELARAATLQGELWSEALAACAASPQNASMLLIPALNAMFDIANDRTAAIEAHTPTLIFALLIAMALGCAFLAGFAMAGARQPNWVQRLVFALVISVTVFVILDMEYPRTGVIRVDAMDRMLVELRASLR